MISLVKSCIIRYNLFAIRNHILQINPLNIWDIAFLFFSNLILYSLQLLTAVVKPFTLSLPLTATSVYFQFQTSHSPTILPFLAGTVSFVNHSNGPNRSFKPLVLSPFQYSLSSLWPHISPHHAKNIIIIPLIYIVNSVSTPIYFYLFKLLFYAFSLLTSIHFSLILILSPLPGSLRRLK